MTGSEKTNRFELYGVDGCIDDVLVDVVAWGEGMIITTQFVCGEEVIFTDTVMNAELFDLEDVSECVEKSVNFALERFKERLKNEGGKYYD